MNIPEKLLEVREYNKEGYSPVVDYCAWRVAVLNYSDQLLPQNLKAVQRHNETDEVFILLRGRCILFIGDGDQEVTGLFGVNMEPFKLYNVKKSTWHTHTLDKDAMVLIVENRDTTFDNSPFCPLSDMQQQMIIQLTSDLWVDNVTV
jgi:hypothetical protein